MFQQPKWMEERKREQEVENFYQEKPKRVGEREAQEEWKKIKRKVTWFIFET